MAIFTFYQDEKNTIWYRTTFQVEADSLEEAKRKVAHAFEDSGREDAVGAGNVVQYNECMHGTAEFMLPSENGCFATIEISCNEDNDYAFLSNGI